MLAIAARIKHRFLLDEAEHLRRLQAQCTPGCEAWHALRNRRLEATEAIIAVSRRSGGAPMGIIGMVAVFGTAAAACTAALYLVFCL